MRGPHVRQHLSWYVLNKMMILKRKLTPHSACENAADVVERKFEMPLLVDTPTYQANHPTSSPRAYHRRACPILFTDDLRGYIGRFFTSDVDA